MGCLVAFAVIFVLSPAYPNWNGGRWLVLLFVALTGGLVAAFIGSLAWIDVRRGVTGRRLRQAQLGAVLGGIAAGVVTLALLILVAFFVIYTVGFFGAEVD